MKRRPHPALLVALAITVAYGSVATWRRLNRPPGRVVGYTECAWRGAPRIAVRAGLSPVEKFAVYAHEAVHATECEQLGPIRYRWRTLFGESNLALEAPAYCAGSMARTWLTGDTAFDRQTMTDNMFAAMSDVVDSATIVRAVATTCPQFAATH